MAAAAPRLARRREPAARALRRALATTAMGRLSGPERGWRERIESKRGELTSDDAATGPSFDPGSEGSEGRFTMERRRTTVAVAVTLMSLTPIWCALLMRLVRELEPRSCLELGTGFGISAAYQAAALELNGAGRLTTLEGAVEWGDRAARSLTELGLASVEPTSGPIAETLTPAAERLAPLDYVYIDAEHQAPATVGRSRRSSPTCATVPSWCSTTPTGPTWPKPTPRSGGASASRPRSPSGASGSPSSTETRREGAAAEAGVAARRRRLPARPRAGAAAARGPRRRLLARRRDRHPHGRARPLPGRGAGLDRADRGEPRADPAERRGGRAGARQRVGPAAGRRAPRRGLTGVPVDEPRRPPSAGS